MKVQARRGSSVKKETSPQETLSFEAPTRHKNRGEESKGPRSFRSERGRAM